jgi:hypothetical protein
VFLFLPFFHRLFSTCCSTAHHLGPLELVLAVRTRPVHRDAGGQGGIMASEADPGRSEAGCGQRAVLKPAAPGFVPGLPVVIATFDFCTAGTTSRRHAE